MEYKKTTWVDHKTPVDAKRLNNIENAIDTLSKISVTPGKLKTINGKSIVGQGDLSLSDLGDISEDDIIEGLGYTPASVEDVPIWTDYHEDGSKTYEVPAVRLGQGILVANGEAAIGRYNLSIPGRVLIVGSGTSNEDRRNSLEVCESGEVYIYGLGGYDGTNSEDPEVVPVNRADLATHDEVQPVMWAGTLAEYKELVDPDPNIIYYIKKS